MADIEGICKVLKGKVRGNPVAVTFFDNEIPDNYEGTSVEPCGILRQAMDDDKRVFFSRDHHDCSHGSYLMGLDNGNEQMRSGRILKDYIPVYDIGAAKTVNSGKFRLPEGTVNAIGAAPLNDVPAGMEIKWIVVVCNPKNAALIAAARSVKDGVMPSAAAGNSFCTDAFATPWYEDNVVMTPGDYGGRINNKLKPEELFVIIPIKYADNLIGILGSPPDVKGIYEATRPANSTYWQKKKAKEEKAQQRAEVTTDYTELAKKYGLKTSMDWEEDAMQMIVTAPKFVRSFAVGKVEDFAEEKKYSLVTLAIVNEQMDESGTRKYFDMGTNKSDNKKKGFFQRLFRQ